MEVADKAGGDRLVGVEEVGVGVGAAVAVEGGDSNGGRAAQALDVVKTGGGEVAEVLTAVVEVVVVAWKGVRVGAGGGPGEAG